MAKAEFRLEGDVGEIVIADPPLNLFDIDLSRDVARAAAEAAGSDARAVLLRAEGDNFSAGVDVDLFVGRDAAAARDLIGEFMPAIRRFAEIEVSTVAAVQGLCLTAGFEIALSCDLIWASDDAQFGLVEAVIGATPFGGGTQRLVARAGAGRAAEAILNGRIYPAETMLEWGVVNRVVEAAQLNEKAAALAARLASGPTIAHSETKRMIRVTVDDGVAAADRVLPDVAATVIPSEDLQSGARSLLEHGPGHAKFANR
jgi:enoyl-CoA hydratase/carnithine racemase